MDAGSFALSVGNHLKYTLAKDRKTATLHDQYWSVANAIRDRLVDRWMATQQAYAAHDVKRVYYLSMEYLPGRTLWASLVNLGLADAFPAAMRLLGFDAEDLIEQEPDAGLGNGGLGRLASCFQDSMATLQLPAMGYGLRYEFGMFRQTIRDGWQVEEPDHWLRLGNPWEITRPERIYPIQFYGRVVPIAGHNGETWRQWIDAQQLLALPSDIPIPGYECNTVNNLRLWAASDTDLFDLDYFQSGDYIRAIERRARGENITKILYPNDKVYAGQELRLRQEFLLASASLQDIIRRYKENHATFDAFADKVAIQINDTHPAIAVAELLRLLVDVEGLDWIRAWDMTVKVFGYTNHTLMPEALEKWPASMLGHVLPRHLEIIYEINHHLLAEVTKRYPGDIDRLRRMSIIEEGHEKQVRMAHLAVVGSHSVNGVSKLHTSLLKSRLFLDFSECYQGRFNAKTNGITPRRWLLACNPDLSALVSSRIGTEWPRHLDHLQRLRPLADDADFRRRWREAKRRNKERLARLIERMCRLRVPVDSLFDIQVKRIHEYKRQLLNILRVIDLYRRMREPSGAPIPARTIVFGGKAAPGYEMAKLIIKLITNVAEVVNRDPALKDRLSVVFLEDYRVSLAEVIIPGADLSEHISTAGMEASGTGNMKFALNGGLIIGTLDGANIEILEEVGADNVFIFGVTAEEAGRTLRGGYEPQAEIDASPRLKAVLDTIAGGYFSPDDRFRFRPIVDQLTTRDPFLVCKDFNSYVACQERVDQTWRDVERWTRMSILNAAGMGKFSTDRTVAEYAGEIWGVKPTPILAEET
ncbi:MAG: glycogen/starch/alpha-glucan phosphorylase [Planctomycetes bacterium]|nr:glycogen/starch/alpha-glucan phosphorylase [Planctomycetota bacterium]